MGAGPGRGALACRLAAGGVRVAVVDRAALPPMEHPDFDGRAYAIAAGSRGLLEQAGVWDELPFVPCPILDIRVSDGKVGRPASPLFLHFDHAEAAAGPFGWMVEARSLRVALNAQLHAACAGRVFAPAQATVTRCAAGAVVQVAGGPPCAAAWWWRRRGASRRCARRPASPCPGWPTGRRASSARSRTSSRTGAPRWSTSCPPARSRSCR